MTALLQTSNDKCIDESISNNVWVPDTVSILVDGDLSTCISVQYSGEVSSFTTRLVSGTSYLPNTFDLKMDAEKITSCSNPYVLVFTLGTQCAGFRKCDQYISCRTSLFTEVGRNDQITCRYECTCDKCREVYLRIDKIKFLPEQKMWRICELSIE